MAQLLSGIPAWVFLVFFGLMYRGYLQTKTRTVSRTGIIVIPLIMLSLSLHGVMQTSNSLLFAMIAWLVGLGLAFSINAQFQHGSGVVLHEDRQHYIVPGSWVPMMLFMSIFFAKFCFGFLVGGHFVNPDDISFIVISTCISGLISGTFAARALQIFQAGASNLAFPPSLKDA